MKKFLFCGVAAFALAACSQQSDTTGATPEKSDKTTIESNSAALGDWGVELSDINSEIDPGDDFYQFVNGKWLDTF